MGNYKCARKRNEGTYPRCLLARVGVEAAAGHGEAHTGGQCACKHHLLVVQLYGVCFMLLMVLAERVVLADATSSSNVRHVRDE